jgi:hypothetical protein
MIYRRNLGSKEQWARSLGGVLIALGSLTQLGTTPLGWALAAGGVVTVVTGIFGFCPACAIAGRKPLDPAR